MVKNVAVGSITMGMQLREVEKGERRTRWAESDLRH